LCFCSFFFFFFFFFFSKKKSLVSERSVGLVSSLASFMVARTSWSASGLHVELRPGRGSFACFWHTLLAQLGAASVSVSVIAPSNRPVVNVPASLHWPLEAEVFEFLLWFRLLMAPARLAELLVAECDAPTAGNERAIGAVRLATVWLLKTPILGDNEGIQTVLTEMLCRQQLEVAHDYRRLSAQLRNVRDAAIVHNDVVKRATGSLAQQLSVRFISMTKIKHTEHFLLLEELGPDTVSRVLMLHACNLWSQVFAAHLAQRVHQVVLPNAQGVSESHPLQALISHHRAVAQWASGVALQSRPGLSSNLTLLATLARMCLKRGDAFSAAAIVQGLESSAVTSVRGLPALEVVDSAKAKVAESGLSETLPSLSALLQAALFAETSLGSGGSNLDALDFGVLRGIAGSHDLMMGCAERARAILLANNGPHLSTDKNLVLSDWVQQLEQNNLTEDELMQKSLLISSMPDVLEPIARSPRFSPRNSPRGSPRGSRKG
jgi:hypothetical protein